MSKAGEWILIPDSQEQIDAVERRCRRLVMQRAALSAGVGVLPLPGLDIMTDIGLFTMLIEDINTAFGLTPAQIARLQPKLRIIVYQALAGVGSLLVGKLITRELVVHLLKRGGARVAARHAVRFVPLAGQLAGAAIGFAAFRAIGNEHVDACVSVARQAVP